MKLTQNDAFDFSEQIYTLDKSFQKFKHFFYNLSKHGQITCVQMQKIGINHAIKTFRTWLILVLDK